MTGCNPKQDRGYPPPTPRQNRKRGSPQGTGYAVGGTPLAVTKEDFLVVNLSSGTNCLDGTPSIKLTR